MDVMSILALALAKQGGGGSGETSIIQVRYADTIYGYGCMITPQDVDRAFSGVPIVVSRGDKSAWLRITGPMEGMANTWQCDYVYNSAFIRLLIYKQGGFIQFKLYNGQLTDPFSDAITNYAAAMWTSVDESTLSDRVLVKTGDSRAEFWTIAHVLSAADIATAGKLDWHLFTQNYTQMVSAAMTAADQAGQAVCLIGTTPDALGIGEQLYKAAQISGMVVVQIDKYYTATVCDARFVDPYYVTEVSFSEIIGYSGKAYDVKSRISTDSGNVSLEIIAYPGITPISV